MDDEILNFKLFFKKRTTNNIKIRQQFQLTNQLIKPKSHGHNGNVYYYFNVK
jgi:predicted transcriptional regulator YdeE